MRRDCSSHKALCALHALGVPSTAREIAEKMKFPRPKACIDIMSWLRKIGAVECQAGKPSRHNPRMFRLTAKGIDLVTNPGASSAVRVDESIAAQARVIYRRTHPQHVELQKRMGIPAHLIDPDEKNEAEVAA